jgi:hypothetical protein
MTYKICYWDEIDGCQKERNATVEEISDINARKANPIKFVEATPTKEQLLAELQALTDKINSL